MAQQKQTNALSPIDSFKKSLEINGPEVAKMLPKHIPAEKFMRVLQTAANLRPEIAQADKRLLWGEIMKCAQDGLVPDGNEATINVYGGRAKYIPMIAGICKKARNSGLIKHIDAIVVYDNDHYESWVDENGPHFKYMRGRGDRGNVRLTFAYATTHDGGFFLEEIDEQQMSAIEKSSKAQSGPWKGPFKDEMRRKSAIRRLAKYRLPSSADVDTVVRRDDDLYDLPSDAGHKQPAPKDEPSRLKNIIDQEQAPEPEAEEAEVVAEAEAPKPEPGSEPI
jgi:recombination protein RecT